MDNGLTPFHRSPGALNAGGSPSGEGDAGEFLATPVSERPATERLVAALKRYKWLCLAVVCVGGAAGGVAARLIEPQFDVQGTIWIEAESRAGRSAVGSQELL